MKLFWPHLLTTFVSLSFAHIPLASAEVSGIKNTHVSGDASNDQPTSIAYLTSWQLPHNASVLLRESRADAYMLSFAKWDKQGKISSSDDIVKKPFNSPTSIPQGYLTWTQTAHFAPQSQMIISFGGQEYEDIWDTMGTQAHSEVIASNIAKLLTTDFPVYQQTPTQNCKENKCNDNLEYKIVGHTQLSGIDFDFEQASRLTLVQNRQLAFLAGRVRALVGNTKSIVLTTYHVGADPLNCEDSSVIKNCSFRESDRSSHHGEVLSLLQSTIGLFDFYNVMTYDAGRNFDYKTAMGNYLNVVGHRSNLRLGISINQQWGQLGRFVMPFNENKNRATWQAKQEYGGFFVWALGASSESRDLGSQIHMFNSLVEATKPLDTQ